MPGSATNYLENKLLDHALGTATFTKPDNVYVGLFTSSPTDTTSGTEVTGGSYSRKLITFGSASSGSAANLGSVDFASMPTCTVVAVGIFTSNTATSNDLLFYSTLSTSRVLVAGDSIRINTGSLIVSLD